MRYDRSSYEDHLAILALEKIYTPFDHIKRNPPVGMGPLHLSVGLSNEPHRALRGWV